LSFKVWIASLVKLSFIIFSRIIGLYSSSKYFRTA